VNVQFEQPIYLDFQELHKFDQVINNNKKFK
jgi:hypothetical protein